VVLAEGAGHRLGLSRYLDHVTRHRPQGPEDLAAPSSDSLLFRHSVRQALFLGVAMVAVAWVPLRLLLSALTGLPVNGEDLAFSLLSVLVGTLIGYGVRAWRDHRRPTWIRVSGLGIELARRGDPVFVPWSQIRSVRVHRRWIFAVFEVAPVDLDAVRSVLPSRDLPSIRYRRGVAMFRVEVGTIRPGRSALRAALARHQPRSGQTLPAE
jgi:hypothetical protein